MKELTTKLYTGFGKTKATLVLISILVYLCVAIFCGGQLLEIILFAVVLLGYIVLPGRLLAQWLQAKTIPSEMHGPLSLLVGAGFFAALYCVTQRLGMLFVLQVVPPLMSVVYIVMLLKKKNKTKLLNLRNILSRQWVLILLWAMLLFLYTFASVAKNGRPSAVGNTLINQDLLWNVGNANSFKLAFPPIDIRFTDVRLHYHYFTELLQGALSIVSGIPAYNIVAFYMQPYMLAALVFSLYRLGLVVWSGNLFKSLLFSWSHFLFSCASLWAILPNGLSLFGNLYVYHVLTNINSMTTSLICLCVFVGLFVVAARSKYRVSLFHYGYMLAALFLLTFSKGPVAAIVVCGMIATLLVGLALRQTGWRGIVFGVTASLMFVVVYMVMFSSGANNSMPLRLDGTLSKGHLVGAVEWLKNESGFLFAVGIPALWAVQSLLMMPAQFPLYIWGVARDIRRFAKISQERLFYNAVAVGGLLAYFLFDHTAMSQAYFLYAAVFFVNLLAVDRTDGLKSLWQKMSSKGKTIAKRAVLCGMAVLAVVGIATTCFLYVHIVGSGARQIVWAIQPERKYPYDPVMNIDDENAALWLRDNTETTAMFATNRIHTGARMEGVSNLYTAFCERQAFMEGYQYAETNMGVSQQVLDERIAINTAIFSSNSSTQEVVDLCRENQIRYLLYSSQYGGMGGSEEQLQSLPIVFSSDTVRIYEVTPA